MEQSSQQIPFFNEPVSKVILELTCLLCAQVIPLSEYERHIALHEQAEMLADILALSRR